MTYINPILQQCNNWAFILVLKALIFCTLKQSLWFSHDYYFLFLAEIWAYPHTVRAYRPDTLACAWGECRFGKPL